ncbi:hypothetical protein BGZ80_003019 [Entomortierella chlamydospora]|uniref:Myb-like domain-containing protein n=1 Tax=Entomortierella chlamydospora TaxID=101097 RepID=A0A9P6SWR6_9FUNG|nr:hypothetical protein BGZ79_001452 [Entomortierella chlamydospora]KAG0008821.1 hypothetical protein BGZ80_003019 [Entomortierella chlamydospora]
MSPPHTTTWTPTDSYTHPHSHSYERPLKTIRHLSSSETTTTTTVTTTTTTRQSWSSEEQEALYIAVEHYNLFGQWAKVKDRMELNRTVLEIEQEYMRLYGELPDSEDEEWSGIENEYRPASTNTNLPGQFTPALTATSSSTLSARSSRETFNIPPTRSSQPTPTEQARRLPYRNHLPQYPLMDDYHDDENDESRMDAGQTSSVSRHPSAKSSTAISATKSRPDTATATDAKPTRTVRVWTVEQSEQLKSLIEDCFPGGYRINWVWVASQMGNTFTRKQCKNKWEIMRRRAGTDEEIALLKKGHDEFGPSWSKIQEKYLPERSQGGISIMWSLLQAREAEQPQQLEKKHTVPRKDDTRLEIDTVKPGHHRKTTTNDDGVQSITSPHTKVSRGSPTKKLAYSPDQQRAMVRPIGDELEAPYQSLPRKGVRDRRHSDHHSRNDSTSRETSLSPNWNREVSEKLGTSRYPTTQYQDDASFKRASVSSTESLTIAAAQQDHQANPHHQQDRASDAGFELWTERNRPMTWTEPLTRRLEEIILQNFPNHQKVNWIKVSALMGTDPVVTKEQCKRRWYLMSHYEHLRPRQSEFRSTVYDPPSSAAAMELDPSEAAQSPEYRHNNHVEPSPSIPNSDRSAEPAHTSALRYQKRSIEYVQWTDEEVELLKLGVMKFGRSWGAIQKHYLKERSLSSIASKWEYVQHKVRPTAKPSPSKISSIAHPEHMPVDSFTDCEMEDEERTPEGALDNQASDNQ